MFESHPGASGEAQGAFVVFEGDLDAVHGSVRKNQDHDQRNGHHQIKLPVPQDALPQWNVRLFFFQRAHFLCVGCPSGLCFILYILFFQMSILFLIFLKFLFGKFASLAQWISKFSWKIPSLSKMHQKNFSIHQISSWFFLTNSYNRIVSLNCTRFNVSLWKDVHQWK